MAQQQRHYVGKAPSRKVDQIILKAAEKKVLETEVNEWEDTGFKTLVLNLITAAKTFKSALKKLKVGRGDHECDELQKKLIIKELADIQNMVKLKILSLREAQIKEVKEEPTKTRNTQSSAQILLNFQSELTSKKSSSTECTGNNSINSKSETFSASKLKSLSKQSLCSRKSFQSDYLDDVDDGDNDFDEVKVEKFKQFLLHVHCPFCLKLEDNTRCLTKHLETTCTAFKSKIFFQSSENPYAVFQLLPNNSFKCNICPNSVQSNLKKYFMHSQSAIHISAHNKAASHKKLTEFIFCAACKVQIPNNVSQILFHVEHKVHQRNRKDIHSSRFFRERGIQCVYNKDRKFKCLTCPPPKSVHRGVKEILHHVELEAHVRLGSSQKIEPLLRAYTVYCMYCLEEVKVSNVLVHFSSSEHAHKEEEESNSEFQMCFYCGFQCSTLLKLAQHTEDCLIKVRQKDNYPESEEFDKLLGQIEKDRERPTEENTSEKEQEEPTEENTSEKEQEEPTKENTSEQGRCIIVKGYPKILELYHYFKEFGEILEVEPAGENTIMIKFQEEKTVDRILDSGKPIEINGVKPKITRKEDVHSSDSAEGSTKSFPVANNDGSDPSTTHRGILGISTPTVEEDFSKVAVDSDSLESLFNRVASHLSYTALKPDCEDFLSVAADCERILKLGKCHSSGFLKCGLSFPAEKITLYCELSSSFIKESCFVDESPGLTELVLFNVSLCKKCVKLLNEDSGICRVNLMEKSFPHVEFYHNKTNKLCTITFRQSDDILADELRYCLKDNGKLRSFVLIIRFWLSVHRLEIREFESVIISLLLFFLLSSGVVNAPSENFNKKLKNALFDYTRTQGSTGRPQNVRKENSIMELFQNFLLFLNEFDFENMAICLPFLYPVPKLKLLEKSSEKYLCKLFNLDAPVWILDPFLFNNMAVDVKKDDWESLLISVRETIQHYHICAKT